jgi:hypothetical protein
MIEGTCHCKAVSWRFDGTPESATACNCTVCRRYGGLWAYVFEGEGIQVSGSTHTYEWGPRTITYHFCPRCAVVAYWRENQPGPLGRHRIGFNLRLAEPELVAAIPLEHFDGLVTFDDLGQDGRCVSNVWF